MTIARQLSYQRGWKEKELGCRPKGDAEKVRMALRLRRETSVTEKWIAAQLRMGSWTYVSNLLAAARKEESVKSED